MERGRSRGQDLTEIDDVADLLDGQRPHDHHRARGLGLDRERGLGAGHGLALRARHRAVEEQLAKHAIAFKTCQANLLFEPGVVLSKAGQPLAVLIPGARLLEIPDRDHMVAVGDRTYKDGVLKFLEARP